MQGTLQHVIEHTAKFPADWEAFVPYVMQTAKRRHFKALKKAERRKEVPWTEEREMQTAHDDGRAVRECLQFLDVHVKGKTDEETVGLLFDAVDEEDVDAVAAGKKKADWAKYKRTSRLRGKLWPLWAAVAAVACVLGGRRAAEGLWPPALAVKDEASPRDEAAGEGEVGVPAAQRGGDEESGRWVMARMLRDEGVTDCRRRRWVEGYQELKEARELDPGVVDGDERVKRIWERADFIVVRGGVRDE